MFPTINKLYEGCLTSFELQKTSIQTLPDFYYNMTKWYTNFCSFIWRIYTSGLIDLFLHNISPLPPIIIIISAMHTMIPWSKTILFSSIILLSSPLPRVKYLLTFNFKIGINIWYYSSMTWASYSSITDS